MIVSIEMIFVHVDCYEVVCLLCPKTATIMLFIVDSASCSNRMRVCCILVMQYGVALAIMIWLKACF